MLKPPTSFFDISNPMIIGLMSGLFGSLIGAAIGAWATLKASKVSLNGLYTHELESRQYAENRQNKVTTQYILKELQENIEISSDVLTNGNYKIRMSREAWNISKGNIHFMPIDLQSELPSIYYTIANFNALIDYEMNKLPHGDGQMNDKIRAEAKKFRTYAPPVISKLQKLAS